MSQFRELCIKDGWIDTQRDVNSWGPSSTGGSKNDSLSVAGLTLCTLWGYYNSSTN